MRDRDIWKILAISIVLLMLVSCVTPSIAVDDSTINTSDRLDEMPFYNATIHVQHSQQSDHDIHIGYQPSTHQIAAILAAEQGWWEEDLGKFGIADVIMKKFPSGPPEMTAMLAGDLDIAYVGVAPPIAAMYEGLDAKIVAGVQTQGSALVVLPELVAEYEGPASLKGKTIATFPPGSIQHTVLSKWFLDNGIDPEGDVYMKAMGPSEATTAISAKAVDAVFLPSPYPTIIEVEGNGVIVEWSGSIWPNHACCCVVASGEMIREYSEIVKQIIKTHIRATEYEIAHPEEAAEIYAQWQGADVSTIKRSINVSDMQWIHDPHLEVESGIKLAAVIYDLNRGRYEGRGVEVFEEEDIFDTSFYDEIRSVIPDVNAKSSIEWHDEDGMHIAMSQNKPAMILFSSDRCPACAMLADELVDTRVINLSKNFVHIVGSKWLDRQYGIRFVPTIVFTNPQGEEVHRLVGYRDANILVEEMEHAIRLSSKLLDVPFFSQRDPAWHDKKVDHSPYSIGEYGCALTSAAMVAKYFGYGTDPDRLNVSLTEVGGLDASGILYWEKVEEVSDGKVEWIGRAEGNWSRLDQELSNKNPVIADLSCSLGHHFIVFIGKIGTDYYFLDPYDENRTVHKWPNGAHGEYTLNNLRIYHRGRQQLVEAINELELAIIDSIDYDVRHVADSYALLATAAELTPWWRELARLALDTIHAVVGTIIEVGEFLTPEGANQALEDASTCQQVINGVKDSKDIFGGIAAFQGLAGLYRNADSYKLSFEAINTVEEVARQEYEVSEDFDRTANAAWLELWLPSTPNGLLIPLKTGAPLKEGSRSSVSRWVNGLKEVREEVKNSFDDVINEIPDPLPADYPLAETITYLKNLKQQIRGGGYRVVKFKCVEDDKEIKRHLTLGMVQEGREATSLLYDAWMDDLDVQYTSTLYNTGETIMHVTTYGFPATGVTKKVVKGVSDLYEVIDIIQLPSDLVNLIDKPVHPLDALQNHTVKMNNDLVHETSNLWALAEGTLKYLQYTWEPAEDSTPAELSGELTIAGSTTVFPINTECARVLMVENPELRISVSGGGSGHGVKAVGEGAIDIGAASRDVKSKEMEMYPDLKPVVVGKDSVAIVLHPSNLVSDLTMEDASKIFSGEITNWKDVGGTDGKIRVITREGGSGTRDCFETSVMKPFDREIAGKASVKPSNGDIRATVSRDEMSIGYLSLGYVDESLKTVKIDGVEATEENVLSGDYPISRSLYIITKGAPSELEKAFIDFALSEEGQKVVEDMGYIRVTEEVTPTSPQENLHEGDISVTTVYHRVRNITDLNNPLDPNNLIFTMHPPDERTNPPYDVGKILDGPKTDNQYGYTWWKIEWDNGEVGWSAEGPFDKPTEKWLKKTDKTFIKIQDLEDPFNYQGEYELNQTELRAEEKKEEVLQNVTKYAKKYKISPALIMAIIRQESDFNANVKGDYWNGKYHSFGYMQVSYGAANDTYKEYTGDEYKGTKEEWKNDGLDPETNIKYGVRYLRILHDRIKDGCPGYGDVYGDILKSTISAYNAGHPTLTNRMCYVLGGKSDGKYAGVIEGKSVNGRHRGYKFFLANRVPSAKPVITTPLETTAKNIYYVGDTLTAKFTITNRAAKSVTFDVLVVGGRDPTGEVVDFDKTYAVTLNPGDSYDYEGYLILPDKPGIYHFFCAYHTEEHMPGEDEYNWNTNIDVEIEGKIVEDFSEAKIYRERDIIVFEETYISPAPPPVLWEEIDGPWGDKRSEVSKIAVHKNNPEVIYAVVKHYHYYWGYEGDVLYKSTNGGDSWIPVNHGLPGLTLSEYYWPIRAIAIAPSNPDIIYVGTSDLNPYSSLLPSAKGIYKSTNGGSEWTSVGGPYTGKWIFKTFCSISSIVVNPTDPDTVFAGTVGGGIWRTTNGGESWERIWDEPINKETLLDVNALAISPANPNTIYAAAYNFDPVNAMGWSGILIPNRFIKSEDGGDTWERLRLGTPTAAPKIDDIAVNYKNADIVYVITEHYKVYNSTDGGKNWDDASGTGGSNPLPYVFGPWSLGKSGSMSIHPDYSNVIYASGEWGFKYVYFSSDSGENWFPFRDLKDRHVKEIVLASNADYRVIYVAAIEGLFKVDISEPEENEMMIKVVEEGDYVRVDYIGKLEDGTVFDTSMKDVAIDAGIYNHKRDYQPLGFTVGAGEMIHGFDKGVVGMVVGEDKTLTIPPEEAYGNYREDLVQVVARDQLPPDSELEVGQMLQASQPNGQIILVTITNVTDSNVTLDANHRLAGKTLIFDVTLVSIGGE